jgi:hypothetical protein
MEQETNAGYVITDRMAIGDFEFVIGQRENSPSQFVTWKCKKGEMDYFWGHYHNDRMSAVKDLCLRSLDEIEYLRSFQPQKDIEKPANIKKSEAER